MMSNMVCSRRQAARKCSVAINQLLEVLLVGVRVMSGEQWPVV